MKPWLIVCVFVVSGVAAQFPSLAEDFEDDTDGQHPEGPYTYTENVGQANSKVVSPGLAGTGLTYQFLPGTSARNALFEFDDPLAYSALNFTADSISNAHTMNYRLVFLSGDPGDGDNLLTEVQWGISSGTKFIRVGGQTVASDDDEHDFRVEFNWTSQDATWYFDGVEETTDNFPAAKTHTSLTGFIFSVFQHSNSNDYVQLDELFFETSYPTYSATNGTFLNDRALSSLWVDLDEEPLIFTRETNNGDFLGGEGLIYALDGDLTVNASRNPCNAAGFPGANALTGVGFSPRGGHLAAHCGSIDGSNDYQFITMKAYPNATVLETVQQRVVKSNEQVSATCTLNDLPWWKFAGGFVSLAVAYANCDTPQDQQPVNQIVVGSWYSAWSGSWLGYDIANGEYQEIFWDTLGATAVEQDLALETDIDEGQVNMDMRSGFYAAVDTADGLRIYRHLQTAAEATFPSLTGKGVAMSLCEAGCPYAAPPKLDNSSYVWIIDDSGTLERYSYNFNTNTLTLLTSASTPARDIRLSWDRQYLLGHALDKVYLYDAETLGVLASYAPTGSRVVTSHMDFSNNYVYALSGPSAFSGDRVERFAAWNVTEALCGDGGASPNPGCGDLFDHCEEAAVLCGPGTGAEASCCDGDPGSYGAINLEDEGGYLNDGALPGNPDYTEIAGYINDEAGPEAARWLFGIALILGMSIGAVKATGTRLGGGIGMATGWVIALAMGLVPVWSIAIGGTLGAGLFAARRF